MRELKGDWRDLFNGFMVALDLRKMFLALCGILFTVFGPLAGTCLWANRLDTDAVTRPETFALDQIWRTVEQSWDLIFWGSKNYQPTWTHTVPYTILFVVAVMAIWAYFGGAIARIASYEVAKDGERIETARALRFAGKKFWSFFMSPWICLIGFMFFALCNFGVGVLGRLLDFGWIGAPLVALVLPLAMLSGFIMTLIVVGTVAGYPLFNPAVAAEGTDAFDAVSRGFSYVYSRPWHFLWYQGVGSVYGVVSCAFVILFAVTLCYLGLQAGACGFDLFGVDKPPAAPKEPGQDATKEQKAEFQKALDAYNDARRTDPRKYEPRYDKFKDVNDAAWAMILSESHGARAYGWTPRKLAESPDPYGRMMNLSNKIVNPNHSMRVSALETKLHKVAAYVVMAWLVIALGLALGYLPSYCISQQTLIYFLLRKKVDGIEMNEVFEEPEDERLGEPVTAPLDKPLVTGDKPAPPPPAPTAPAAPPESPKS